MEICFSSLHLHPEAVKSRDVSIDRSLIISSSFQVQSRLEESEEKIRKKAAKKEAAKLEKLRRRQEQDEAAGKTAYVSIEDEPLSRNYGDVTFIELQSTEDTKAGKWREAVQRKE